MSNLIVLFEKTGFILDDNAPTVIKMSLYFLILSLFILSNVVNIMIYLFSIYIVTHEKFLNKIPTKYSFIHKYLIFYKNIRVTFIALEFIFILLALFLIIGLSYGVVSYYMQLQV